jgi:hypothetical protein
MRLAGLFAFLALLCAVSAVPVLTTSGIHGKQSMVVEYPIVLDGALARAVVRTPRKQSPVSLTINSVREASPVPGQPPRLEIGLDINFNGLPTPACGCPGTPVPAPYQVVVQPSVAPTPPVYVPSQTPAPVYTTVAPPSTYPVPIPVYTAYPSPTSGPEVTPEASMGPEVTPEASMAPEVTPEASTVPEVTPEASTSPEVTPEASMAPEVTPESSPTPTATPYATIAPTTVTYSIPPYINGSVTVSSGSS